MKTKMKECRTYIVEYENREDIPLVGSETEIAGGRCVGVMFEDWNGENEKLREEIRSNKEKPTGRILAIAYYRDGVFVGVDCKGTPEEAKYFYRATGTFAVSKENILSGKCISVVLCEEDPDGPPFTGGIKGSIDSSAS